MVIRPTRRWLRYSLRTLLVAVVVLGAFLGWLGREASIVQERKAAIEEVMSIEAQSSPLVPLPRIATYHSGVWRRWMGDITVAEIILPRSLDAISIDKEIEISQLLPEADVKRDWSEPERMDPYPDSDTGPRVEDFKPRSDP